MAEQELSLLISLKDEASAQLKQLNKEIESNAKTWRENFGAIRDQAQTAGIAMVAFGAAVTGAFLYAYKASEENRIATARLTNDLRNLGISYSSVKGEIDAFTAATQKSTGIGKGEQMAGLSQLLLITGDYKKAIEILPIALDLAAAKQMGVTQAAILLGRVVEGDINALNRYGFSMDGVTSAGEALNVIQEKIKGSAAAMMSPLDVLRASLTDLAEAIGNLVAGPAGEFISKIIEVVEAITKWAEANPEAAKSIALFALAMGIGIAAAGFLGLAIAGVIYVLGLLGGPVTIVLALIALLGGFAIWLWTQWDWFRENWTACWAAIKAVLVLAIGPLGYLIGLLIQSAFDIQAAWDPMKDFWGNLWMAFVMILRNAVNDVIYLLNLVPKALNSLMDILGVKHTFQLIPELTAGMFGVTGSVNRGGLSAEQWEAFGGYGGTGGAGGITAPPYNQFGNYGNLGQTFAFPGGISVTINNAGSVISDQDLAAQIRQILIDIQNRNVTTGIR